MRKNQKYSQEEMFSAIENCQRDGISTKEYCREKQIPYPSFQYWLRKYRKELINQNPKPTEGFLPVRIEDTPISGSNQLTIQYPNGIQVRCPLNTPVHLLQSLIIS
jgi:transposase-like protein